MICLKQIKEGDKLFIHCYKHDGSVHRAWDQAVVLKMAKEYLICGNNRTKVMEKNGSVWKTTEPAIMFFFKNRWFNIIAQLKKDGIYYYCNIATPFIIEEGVIKYIDYDLDLRVFPSGEKKVLDEMEYTYHRNEFEYSRDLDLSIKKGLEDLIRYFDSNDDLISKTNINEYHQMFKMFDKRRKMIDK